MGIMSRAVSAIALAAVIAAISACSSGETELDRLSPPPVARQDQLVRIFDRLGHDIDAEGRKAADEASQGTEKDRRYLVSLWGTRSKSAAGAERYADALSKRGHHQEALEWYERAYLALEQGAGRRPWLRYEMAEEYIKLGRNQDAIELLSNRLGLAPLPPELQKKYDALVRRAAAGG